MSESSPAFRTRKRSSEANEGQGRGQDECRFSKSFEVDLEMLTEDCEVKVDNFRQVIHEEPKIKWSFLHPSDPTIEYCFEICLYPDPAQPPTSGRHPPRNSWWPRGNAVEESDPFRVVVKNVGKNEIKGCLAVKVLREDGGLREQKKEKCATRCPPNSAFHLSGFGRLGKMLTPQGTLLLLVEMQITKGLKYTREGAKKIKLDNKKSFKSLTEDISQMMNHESLSDITLKCQGDEEVKCSKFMLCARSKVFKAMFSHSTKESQEGSVNMPEEAATVKDLVEFIYCDQVKDICIERTAKLLPISERYDIASLSSFCCEALGTHLDVEHVAEIALVADQHGLKTLKEKAISYMLQHSSRVIKTEGWLSLLHASPTIANRIVASLSKFRDDRTGFSPEPSTSSGGGQWIHFGGRSFNPEDEEVPRYYVGGANHAAEANPRADELDELIDGANPIVNFVSYDTE